MEPYSQILTGLKDVDIEILANLDDITLEEVCLTNQYASSVCHNSKLWYLKIVNNYPDFPLLKGISAVEWKKLYYKLKFQDWTAIMVWADVNNISNLIDWILKQKEYKAYFNDEIRMYIRLTRFQHGKERLNTVIMLFNFLYNNRFRVMSLKIENPRFYQAIINKLYEFIEEGGEFKEIGKLYLRNIFNITH